MSSFASLNERITRWKDRWNAGQIGFHKKEIHPFLAKHLDKLIPGSQVNKIFFPLCGKAVDMKWLADLDFTVVGVDGVPAALEQFFKEQELECVVEDVVTHEKNVKVFKSKDDKIKLYCTDIFNFTSEFEGTVDAVWDRGSLVALDRTDVPQYVQVIKKLLSPKGRILLETMEYDVAIMNDVEGPTAPPPPHPMFEEEIKRLYEPECMVELVEKGQRELAGKEINLALYLIVKKF